MAPYFTEQQLNNAGHYTDIKQCFKCGNQLLAQNKFCTKCGDAINYSLTSLQLAGEHPIYKEVGVLHEQFSDFSDSIFNNTTTKYKYFNDLISIGALHEMSIFARVIIDLLNKDFEANQEIRQTLELSKDSLKSLYFTIITDGYFSWVAENKIKGSRLSKPFSPDTELFYDEFVHTNNLIYPDFIESLTSSQDGKYISNDIARIFYTLSIFHGFNIFDANQELKPLEHIYNNIQANFVEAIVGGYAIALVDAKYRK